MRPPFLDTQLYKMPWFCTERRGAPRNVLFSLKRGYGEMSEFSHQAGISKLRDKVAILPRHGVRHPHEEVSGVQEGEAVRLPPMSLIIVTMEFGGVSVGRGCGKWPRSERR